MNDRTKICRAGTVKDLPAAAQTVLDKKNQEE
jgi:hypothetical protein